MANSRRREMSMDWALGHLEVLYLPVLMKRSLEHFFVQTQGITEMTHDEACGSSTLVIDIVLIVNPMILFLNKKM